MDVVLAGVISVLIVIFILGSGVYFQLDKYRLAVEQQWKTLAAEAEQWAEQTAAVAEAAPKNARTDVLLEACRGFRAEKKPEQRFRCLNRMRELYESTPELVSVGDRVSGRYELCCAFNRRLGLVNERVRKYNAALDRFPGRLLGRLLRYAPIEELVPLT